MELFLVGRQLTTSCEPVGEQLCYGIIPLNTASQYSDMYRWLMLKLPLSCGYNNQNCYQPCKCLGITPFHIISVKMVGTEPWKLPHFPWNLACVANLFVRAMYSLWSLFTWFTFQNISHPTYFNFWVSKVRHSMKRTYIFQLPTRTSATKLPLAEEQSNRTNATSVPKSAQKWIHSDRALFASTHPYSFSYIVYRKPDVPCQHWLLVLCHVTYPAWETIPTLGWNISCVIQLFTIKSYREMPTVGNQYCFEMQF